MRNDYQNEHTHTPNDNEFQTFIYFVYRFKSVFTFMTLFTFSNLRLMTYDSEKLSCNILKQSARLRFAHTKNTSYMHALMHNKRGTHPLSDQSITTYPPWNIHISFFYFSVSILTLLILFFFLEGGFQADFSILINSHSTYKT